MHTLPACLVPDLSTAQLQRLDSWWRQLDPNQQAELACYFDSRAEDAAFTLTDEQQWEPLPISSRGVFMEEDDPSERKILSQDTFDYLDDDPRRFMHDNDCLRDETFTWRHLEWKRSPRY